MEETSSIPQANHGIMGEEEEEEESLGSMSSLSKEDDLSNSAGSSLSSELMEDADSSTSSPSSKDEGPLYEMSSLFAQLPLKRGLSKHFIGKSQSFTFLSNVRSLEDLAKPERPYKKKLKSSKSYALGLDHHKQLSTNGSSKAIAKKSSRGSFSSLINMKRVSSLGSSRHNISPQRCGSLSGQNLLFASGIWQP